MRMTRYDRLWGFRFEMRSSKLLVIWILWIYSAIRISRKIFIRILSHLKISPRCLTYHLKKPLDNCLRIGKQVTVQLNLMLHYHFLNIKTISVCAVEVHKLFPLKNDLLKWTSKRNQLKQSGLLQGNSAERRLWTFLMGITIKVWQKTFRNQY